jgi:endoglucanase
MGTSIAPNNIPGAVKRAGSILGMSIALITFSQGAFAGCEYVVTNSWGSGFTAAVRITNTGSSPINGWNVSWQYNSNRITNLWNANLSGGNPYSASNLGWNSTIQPGQTVEFGFQGTSNGAAEKPSVTGSACAGGVASSVAPSSVPKSSVAPSSVPKSSVAPSSVPKSSSSPSGLQCNWYGTLYPLCVTTTSGWGWESNKSCISRSTCVSQPSPYGVVGENTPSSAAPSSVPKSSIAPSSIPKSSVAPSSVPKSSIAPSSVPSTSAPSSVPKSSVAPSSVTSSSVGSSSGGTAGTYRVNAQGKITENGTVFPVKCGSWFGLEGQHEPKNAEHNPDGAPMELYMGNMWWANTGRTIQQTMTEIKALGINMIRFPIAPQTLDATNPQGIGSVQDGGVLKNSKSVLQTNSRQALESFIKLAAQNNIKVLIDIHSCSNYVGWRAGVLDAKPPYVDATRVGYDYTREGYSCSATGNPSSVTHVDAYNEAKWLADLKTIAGLPKALGVNNIIGIDIFNEPWGYSWGDWKTLSEKAYTAINSVNTDVLVFVEGVSGGTIDGTKVPHGDLASNPNWGENFYGANTDPLNIPKDRVVISPHTYGPSVFVQKQFVDQTDPACVDLEGEEAGNAKCKITLDATRLEAGWDEHFGFLKAQGYAMVVGEFGGNMDWPKGASADEQSRWSHINTTVDRTWQELFVDYMKKKDIQGCYWSINPESADTGGLYLHSYDPVSNKSGWGTWLDFDPRKTDLVKRLWNN